MQHQEQFEIKHGCEIGGRVDDGLGPPPAIFAGTHKRQLAVWRENGFRTRDGVLAIRKELAKVLGAAQIAA